MRKDLQKMSKVIAQVKNPNFPPPPTENEMKASTTYVDMNIPNPSKEVVTPKKSNYDPKSKTFEPQQMWKDLKKGVSMIFGYYDKPAPPTGS